MPVLVIILQLIAVILVAFVIIKFSRIFWQMLAWLRTELSAPTPRALAIRIGGIIIGLAFSLLAMGFACFWIALNQIGYSAPWRPLWSAWTFIPPAIAVWFTFAIVYLFFCPRNKRTLRVYRWSVSPVALVLTVSA